MNAKNSPAERLLSIDELDRDIVSLTDRINAGTLEVSDDDIGRDIGNNFSELSNVINNPSAEGFFVAAKTSVVSSAPP